MFGWGAATKIYVAAEAVDMRKGFEGCTDWCAINWGRIR